MIRLHAESKSKITVSQIFSKELPQRQNEALQKRKEILKESPEHNIYLGLRASLMGKKKQCRAKYKEIEKILKNFLSVCSSVGILQMLQTSFYFTF